VSAELLILDSAAGANGKPALDAKGKPVPAANHAGRGAAEKLSGQVPAGAHAIVRVRGEGTAEGAYDVSVADGE
jgi:hypothetical protein